MSIDLTVVVPTYNRRELLIGAIQSLRKQSHPADRYEIIIVSDGCTDGTDEEFAQPLHSPSTRLLRQEKRGYGLAAARNRGAWVASGDLVLFLDDDMVAAPDLVSTHLQAHGRFDQSVAVCGRVEPADDVPDTPFCRLILSEVCHGFRGDPQRARFIPCESAFSWQTSFKIDALRRLDGYDESFRAYGWEDVDFAFRASQSGVRFFYEPAAVSYHRDRRDTLQRHGQRLHEASRNAPFLFARNPELRSRIPMYADKEPIDWRHDSVYLLAAKAARVLLANRTVRSALETLTPAMEPILSPNLLRRWYNAILGGYVFNGYREGLVEAATAPAPETRRDGSDSGS